MVNGLAFYSDDTSLNPMEGFFVEMLLLEKRANVNKKIPRFNINQNSETVSRLESR